MKPENVFPSESRVAKGRRARDNPFAVSRVRRIRYRMSEGEWETFMNRLRKRRFRGALVGPEGAGKTTLLEDLGPRLAREGWTTHWLQVEEGKCALPAGRRSLFPALGPSDCLLLDSAERLRPWSWAVFRYRTRRVGGLIVTTHRPGRLPTLLECRPRRHLLLDIVEELTGESGGEIHNLALQLFERHQGNVRDVLWALYDVYAGR
jgi:hypothetical protein